MKNKAFVKKAAATVAAAVLIFVCGGCKKETLKGKTLFMDDGSLSMYNVSSWGYHDHNVSYFWNDGEDVDFSDAPRELTIDFLGDEYTADYVGSDYTGEYLRHNYIRGGVHFSVDAKLKPTSIAFFDRDEPYIEKGQEVHEINKEELIISAKNIFEQYCGNNTEVCPDPVFEVYNQLVGKDCVRRLYIVKFFFSDERTKDYPTFEVYYSVKGEIVSSDLCAPTWTAQYAYVKNNLSYDNETIKAEVMKRCQPIIDDMNEKDWLEFVSIEISDGRIDYVYIDDKAHIGVYSEVTIKYIRENSNDMVEKWNVPKYTDETDCLTFVTVLD